MLFHRVQRDIPWVGSLTIGSFLGNLARMFLFRLRDPLVTLASAHWAIESPVTVALVVTVATRRNDAIATDEGTKTVEALH